MISLFIGKRDTNIVIVKDDKYDKMFRIIWPDGKVSSMGNLTRAKEASILYARSKLKDWDTVHRWNAQQAGS